MKKWYEELFDDYSKKYDTEVFTQGTKGEVDFIENEAEYNKSIKILDIGCGTGRHSIELSKRGYSVTGIDLSESQLNAAKSKAEFENLNIDFLKMDARYLTFNEEFDLAIMICEGAFPLMETDEMNYEILMNAYRSLKQNGKLIFTTLNGLFPVFHSIDAFINENNNQGQVYSSNFNFMTFRDTNLYQVTDDNGIQKELECNERYYIPSEISWLLKSAGFKKNDIYASKLGEFSRNDKLTPHDYEMLVIAVK
jgi:2-polyprenyl-3-methyl-5-hydroxy-6-metoxy-1,4-benzoquinol methylase